MGIGQSLEANLVVGGLCSLPYFFLGLRLSLVYSPVDFGFAFLAFIEACFLPIKKNIWGKFCPESRAYLNTYKCYLIGYLR